MQGADIRLGVRPMLMVLTPQNQTNENLLNFQSRKFREFSGINSMKSITVAFFVLRINHQNVTVFSPKQDLLAVGSTTNEVDSNAFLL